MQLKRETICENTLELIQEYYHLNTEPLFSVLADDCVWMGMGNVLASGAASIRAIREFVEDGFLMPPFHLEKPDFQLVETGCGTQMLVLGQYVLYSDRDARMIGAVKQRATFCYRKEESKWRLYHMHISNVWNEQVRGDIFPARISTRPRSYVRKMSAESVSRKSWMVVTRAGLANQIVDSNMVTYIQAVNGDCIFHMLNKRREISWGRGCALKDLQERLPANFYRIHRSFYVNSDYVMKIRRYAVTLVTGEELPVPKMRYTQIREELTTLIEKRVYRKEEKT